MVNLQTWLKQGSAKWMKEAACAAHQGLPWTGVSTELGEVTPTAADQKGMAQVCADCPVLHTCAAFALSTPGVGGFYAGIWLPWPQQGGGPRARRTLRKVFSN